MVVDQRKAAVVATIRRLKTVMLPRARAAVAAAEARLNDCLERPAQEKRQTEGVTAPTG
ncbi:MAG: hypothetical protein H0V93_07740 [Euzebyales bacterium]|jgi:hypothetical protein|nr:hypothetical protein [Euzebyales bacterium]